MQIHLARNNVSAGPYSLDELNTMLKSGEVELTDLMWHEGMDNWKPVGEMTGGQTTYIPQVTTSPDLTEATQTIPANQDRQSVVDSFAANQDRHSTMGQSTTGHENSKEHSSTKHSSTSHLPNWAIKHKERQEQLKDVSDDRLHRPSYAGIGSRLMATLINMATFFLVLMPFVMAFIALNPDPAKINSGNFAERMAYAQVLAEQISPNSVILTFVLLVVFVVAQCVMIMKQGQSIGKLALGIRVVDEATGKLPPFGRIIGIRTVVLSIIYWIASAFPMNLALILLAVNYFLAMKSDKKQGWHDRLANTIVVKAQKNQLPQKEPHI